MFQFTANCVWTPTYPSQTRNNNFITYVYTHAGDLTSGEGWRREGALAGEALNLEVEAEESVWEDREATFSR